MKIVRLCKSATGNEVIIAEGPALNSLAGSLKPGMCTSPRKQWIINELCSHVLKALPRN